jgi:cytochrome c oxidase subunit II
LRTRRALVVVVALSPALAGCGRQSTLDPHSEPAHNIATLWWWMLLAAGIVFAGAIVLIVLSWVRRKREGLPILGKDEGVTTGAVVFFGIVVPVLTLAALFAVANFEVAKGTSAPSTGSTKMTVEVIGRQWFWEVRYPGTTAVTANEIHIPARTRVNLVAKTADVIHSFWIPELNRKIDMIPGRTNRILLYADKPGVYRGQCGEFCGLQHAHMGMFVVADPPARFRAWLANMARPRVAPATAQQRRGETVFLTNQCASCHSIRGTAARGTIGPDLTHLATRTTLAAATIPNTEGYLGGWILDPQHVKPGNKMPALNLSPADFHALLDYLVALR